MGRLKGTVKNDDGSPAADAVVTVSLNNAWKGQDTTGSDGSYNVGRLDPGKYQVVVEVNEQESFKQDVDVSGLVTSLDISLPAKAASAGAGSTSSGSTTSGSSGTSSGTPGGTGSTGSTGTRTPDPTGSTGSGASGSTGSGSTGSTGSGSTGSTGSGSSGSTGTTDTTGAGGTGTTGSTGTGTTGTTGSGASGSTGTTDTTGASGTGATGSTGSGTTGSTGSGASGSTGSGASGSTGSGAGAGGAGGGAGGTGGGAGAGGAGGAGGGTGGAGAGGAGAGGAGSGAAGGGGAGGAGGGGAGGAGGGGAAGAAAAPDPFADLKALTDGVDYSAEPRVNIDEANEFRRMYTVGVYVLADVPRAISVLNDALVETNGNNGIPTLGLINKGQLQARNSAKIQTVLTRRAEDFNNEERVKAESRREFNLGNSAAASANTEFKALYSEFVNLAADDLMGIDPNTLAGKVVFDAKEREQILNFLKKLKRSIIKLTQNMSVAGTLGTRPLLNKWSEILKDSLEVLNDVATNNIASDDADDRNVWSLLASLTNMPRSTVKAYVVHAKDGGSLLEYAVQIYQVIQDAGKLEDETDDYLRELFYAPGFVFKNPDRAAAFVLKPRASVVKDNWALPTWA